MYLSLYAFYLYLIVISRYQVQLLHHTQWSNNFGFFRNIVLELSPPFYRNQENSTQLHLETLKIVHKIFI